MTKASWIKHIEDKGHFLHPSKAGGVDLSTWKWAVKNHRERDCKECNDRLKTIRANNRRKERDSIMASLGLTKVKGAVSGKTYWE